MKKKKIFNQKVKINITRLMDKINHKINKTKKTKNPKINFKIRNKNKEILNNKLINKIKITNIYHKQNIKILIFLERRIKMDNRI